MHWHKDYTLQEALEDIDALATQESIDIDAERKTGEWIPIEKPRLGNPYRHYKCSVCGNPVPYKVRYCDSCGSKNDK